MNLLIFTNVTSNFFAIVAVLFLAAIEYTTGFPMWLTVPLSGLAIIAGRYVYLERFDARKANGEQP